MRPLTALLLSAMLCAGCSRSAPHVSTESGGAGGEAMQPSAEPQLVWQDYEQLVLLDQEVEMLVSQQDCVSACDAGQRLCVLSERICTIADRNGGDAELEGRCVDGRARCTRAQERLSVCGCGN